MSLILYLYEMMDSHRTYCGNHFKIYVSQIIMLYILNLHSAVIAVIISIKLEEKNKLYLNCKTKKEN